MVAISSSGSGEGLGLETGRGYSTLEPLGPVCFLGVLPRADFNHLINVYQPVLALLVIGAAVLFGQGRWRAGRARQGCAGAAALVFLCYAGVGAV